MPLKVLCYILTMLLVWPLRKLIFFLMGNNNILELIKEEKVVFLCSLNKICVSMLDILKKYATSYVLEKESGEFSSILKIKGDFTTIIILLFVNMHRRSLE